MEILTLLYMVVAIMKHASTILISFLSPLLVLVYMCSLQRIAQVILCNLCPSYVYIHLQSQRKGKTVLKSIYHLRPSLWLYYGGDSCKPYKCIQNVIADITKTTGISTSSTYMGKCIYQCLPKHKQPLSNQQSSFTD